MADVHSKILVWHDSDDTDRNISNDASEEPTECTFSSNIKGDNLDHQQEVLHRDQAMINTTNYNGSTANNNKLRWFCHFTHSTFKSATFSNCHSTTITQMPNANHQYITRGRSCTCPGVPASQGLWRLECSSTKGRWRSLGLATPNGHCWGGETVHGGNRIPRDSVGNDIWWEVLDGWWS